MGLVFALVRLPEPLTSGHVPATGGEQWASASLSLCIMTQEAHGTPSHPAFGAFYVTL
jgi:hypothetical protein